MRPPHPTCTGPAVHRLAQQALAASLHWTPVGRSLTVPQLLDLLLLMATTTQTLFAIVRRYLTISHETARHALRANLTDLDTLTTSLVESLHHVLLFSRRDRRRSWTLAIDTHNCPYYGDRHTPAVIGGPRQAGTKSFFGYATAVLLHRRRRYTVGLIAVTASTPPHQIVQTLLDQIQTRGLLVGGVVLDSGFCSGETLLLLQRRGHSYTVPLRRCGRGTNRRNACFTWPSGTIGDVSWVTERTREAVTTRVLVWQRSGQPEVKVYAFRGWGEERAVAENRRAWLARRRYRERFGIETSYRQKNQVRAWTTSRCVKYRLLLEGVAHLLRQIWVRLMEQLARAGRLTPTVWVEWRLDELRERLADHLKSSHAPTPQPPKPLQQSVTH